MSSRPRPSQSLSVPLWHFSRSWLVILWIALQCDLSGVLLMGLRLGVLRHCPQVMRLLSTSVRVRGVYIPRPSGWNADQGSPRLSTEKTSCVTINSVERRFDTRQIR